LEIKELRIDQLKPWGKNPRKHDVDALVKSIEHFGFRSPLVVNHSNGDYVVEAGHGRLKAAQKVGLKSLLCIIVEDDEATAAAYALADNKLQERTEWLLPELKDILESLDTGAFDMDLTGFDTKEIEDLMNQTFQPTEGLTDDDAIPEQVETICKKGDLWKLGEHRLLCGDATVTTDVERLMAGEKADMVFTDPPYGVAVNTGSKEDLKARNRRTDGKVVANDDLTGDNLKRFMEIVFSNYFIVLKEGGCIYVCHAEGLGMDVLFRGTFADAGFKPAEIIVWVKDQFAFGRQDYHWRHEPIIYGWKEGAAHYFIDDHTQDTVWNIPRPKKSEQHPTMKPVELCEKAINNSSRLNEVVADLFGGSGTTMIACEKTGRKCRMMEIDEHYCDVIITRWQDFTGKKAELINGP
jgi:DNA modification methylase